MIEWIKEVGRGRKGAKDLPYEEALKAAQTILTGQATPAQIGAFLIAERIKMETTEEIVAFVDSCRESFVPHPIANALDCAGPYDGRRTSFMATFPVAFVLGACGLPVTLHGSSSLPPKWGITLKDIVQSLSVPVSTDARQTLLTAAEQSKFLFVPTDEWCPALQNMRSIRLELGVRTVFNTVEKLLRFSNAPYMAVGVFHGTVFDKIAQLLIRVGVEKGIVVQGMEGSEDLTVTRLTRTLVIQNGEYEFVTIDPANYGLKTEIPEAEWTPELQLQMAVAVLQGEADTAFRNLVLLNSAVRLWVTGYSSSIEEGLEQARTALDEGAAWKQYQKWLSAVLAGS